MRPPVWIGILVIFIETNADQDSPCYGRPLPCGYFNISCPGNLLIQIDMLQYGLYNKAREHCRNISSDKCPGPGNACCTYDSDDCFQNFSENHTEYVKRYCLGRPSCTSSIQAVWTTAAQPNNCSGQTTDYVFVIYTCVLGTSGTTSTSFTSSLTSGKSEDGNSLPAIIVVVIAAIFVIALVAVALIIVKRRQKKHTKEATVISDLPKGLTNYAYESSTEAGKSKTVIETSNYDIINDESVLTYCLPDKNKKDTARVPGRAKKCGDVSADEYDKIEFETNGAIKASNYDTLHTMEGKIGDDPYSHASIQLKSVTTAKGIANDYSHCKLNSKDTLKNDDEYSHVDHEGDRQKNPEASNIEDDSYNHIDFDDNKHPTKNGKAVIGENESE